MNRVVGISTLVLITPLFAACGYRAQDTSGRVSVPRQDLVSAPPGPFVDSMRVGSRRSGAGKSAENPRLDMVDGAI